LNLENWIRLEAMHLIHQTGSTPTHPFAHPKVAFF